MTTPTDHAAQVRDAHNRAMEALAADIHPYAHGAIVEWEKVMDAALDALTALAERVEAAEKERDEANERARLMVEAYEAADAETEAAEARAEEAEARVKEMEARMLLAKSRLDWCIGYLDGYDQDTNEHFIRGKLIEARAALAAGSL